jgi:hypothetical protein
VSIGNPIPISCPGDRAKEELYKGELFLLPIMEEREKEYGTFMRSVC